MEVRRRIVSSLRVCLPAALAVLITGAAHAQTVVAGNLGPGGTYQHGTANSWRTGVDDATHTQFENAVSFTFGGAVPTPLLDFTWIVNYYSGSADIFADFMEGPDIATATTLSTATRSAVGAVQGQEFVLTSGMLGFFLQPGQTYWIRLYLAVPGDADAIWGWQWNDQGQNGYSARFWDITDPTTPVDNGWFPAAGTTPAYEVRTLDAAAVPEPATVALVATGLLVVGGLTRRRGRRTAA